MSGTDTLPQENSEALRDAYEAYRGLPERSSAHLAAAVALASLAKSGCNNGWPVRALAEPCEVTPERLRQVIATWAPARLPSDVLKYPVYERATKAQTPKKPKAKRSTLTGKEIEELASLTGDARQNTGSRSLDHPIRKKSELLSKLIIKYHNRGVIWQDLADACGLTYSGVRMRAARHGHGNSVSIQQYMRVDNHAQSRPKPRPKLAKVKTETAAA